MQMLLLPSNRTTVPAPSMVVKTAALSPLARRVPIFTSPISTAFSLSSPCFTSVSTLSSHFIKPLDLVRKTASFATPSFAGYGSPVGDSEQAKLAQVAKRLEKTARYFKRLGSFAFWGQLICSIVSAVILSFSVVVTGRITSPVTFYATAGAIVAAFISVFWSFGYLRLSERLRKTANDPSKAPPRAEVVTSLRNGIVVNILGLGAAILGLQATVGLLVAKALTTSATPYQNLAPGSSPVLALDVFLVQAAGNTILSHFFGLVSSLELLRSVTLPPSQTTPVAKVA